MKNRAVRKFWKTILRIPPALIVSGVKCYQLLVSPLLGPRCRFQPTCSEYFIHSVLKHGAIHGSLRGLIRICKCHPFHPGGIDPP